MQGFVIPKESEKRHSKPTSEGEMRGIEREEWILLVRRIYIIVLLRIEAVRIYP